MEAWVSIAPGSQGSSLRFIADQPIWVPYIGPNDVFNTVIGKVWMDHNLCATQVADSSNHEESYGDLFQWGRDSDGHEIRTSQTTTLLATKAEASMGNSWDGKFILGSTWLQTQDSTL